MPTTRSKQAAGPKVDPSDHGVEDDVFEDAVDRDDANTSAVGVKKEEGRQTPKPNDDTLEILSDLIQYEAEMMFWDREHRAQHWKSLEFFWKMHPASNYAFGGLYTRRWLALLLVVACSQPPYGNSSGEEEDNDDGVDLMPLKTWNRLMWEHLEKDLNTGRDQCLRKDSAHIWNLNLTEAELSNFQDPTKDKKRSKSDLFNKKYNVVMKLLEIQKVLAPIRERLVAALEKGEKGKIKIPQRELDEILDYAQVAKHQGVKEIIGVLFEEDKTLKSAKDLEPILTASPFDLEKLQSKLEFMVQKWSREVFRGDPELVKLKYRVERSSATMLLLKLTPTARSSISPAAKSGSPARKSRRSTTQADLDELRRGRAALNNNHGADPLESSRKLAQEAGGAAKRHRDDKDQESDSSDEDEDHQKKKRARGGALYDKKKSATRLVFMDDIEADDEEEEERERIELSAISSDNSYRFPRTYEGLMPEEGRFDGSGKVTKRRPWLPEEKNAIKAAVEKIGWDCPNRWVQVKQMYQEILRNRTAVQIKDCWRTMEKKGEVQNPEEEGE